MGTLRQILNNKADLVEGKVHPDQLPNTILGITNWEDIEGKPLVFPPETHLHPEIVVPTQLAQLQDDSTHRLVTDTEKTLWSNPQGGGDLWTIKKLASDFVTNATANNPVTGFNFTPSINKTYLLFGYFLLRTATATVGARPGISFPTNLVDSILRMEASNSLTASAVRTWGAMTTQNAASTGLATNTHSHWGSLDGIIITGALTSGNFQITLASETAGTNVTMKAGSILMYREL